MKVHFDFGFILYSGNYCIFNEQSIKIIVDIIETKLMAVYGLVIRSSCFIESRKIFGWMF